MAERLWVTTGVSQLDQLMGGLFVGDNVVWLDDSGSLASVFCLNFMQASQARNRPILYVSFDRSPRNLLDKLGPLASNPFLIVLDCFTCGKGARSPVFLKFYQDGGTHPPCRIVMLEDPRNVEAFLDVLYNIHASLEGDVRFVFESLTGMQELWGGEEELLKLYTHACPRLYELNTVAYWIMEKQAHSSKLRAQIGQVAQVMVELSIKRGTTSLTVLKAEGRQNESFHKAHTYWTRDLTVRFDEEKRSSGGIDLGVRLRELRAKRGLSQTELARLVGVTPSTISQVESNLIYPSLPALLRMAEVLRVDASYFFSNRIEGKRQVIFPALDASEVHLSGIQEESAVVKALIPVEIEARAEPYLIRIPPGAVIGTHFFVHKGEEFGYLVSGDLQVRFEKVAHSLGPGDTVYLTSEAPTSWKNVGKETAVLLWAKLK